jgi:hypothetical protein
MNPPTREKRPTFLGCIVISLLIAGYTAGITYGLYAETKSIADLHPVRRTNCTIVDAQFTTDDNDDKWTIHVNYMVPSDSDPLQPTNETALLQGTDVNEHYSVNETLSCLVSIRKAHTVSLKSPKVDGDTSFLVFILCLAAIPIVVMVLYPIFIGVFAVAGLFYRTYKWSAGFFGGPEHTTASTVGDVSLLQIHNINLERGTSTQMPLLLMKCESGA